ncbi:MAG: 50S ribosomal protein L11 methyltransferase [Myxococcota bacterium]
METHWMELRVLVPESDVLALEELEAEILTITPGGFAVEAWDAPPSDRAPVAIGWTRYLVYVGEAQLEDARVRLAHAVAAMPTATVEVSRLPEGWRDRWKMYFKPIDVSARFIVAPPWERPEATAGKTVLLVEPGMAFGTAQHETTALCIAGIDELQASGFAPMVKVLDVGCGTGILAIAAGALGASELMGTDIDPNAMVAARENEELNRPVLGAARCSWETTPIEEVGGEWDLVVANILTPTLIILAAPIAARVRAGGRLMLSGILVEHEAEILEAFLPLGLQHLATTRKNGWIRVDLARPAAG